MKHLIQSLAANDFRIGKLIPSILPLPFDSYIKSIKPYYSELDKLSADSREIFNRCLAEILSKKYNKDIVTDIVRQVSSIPMIQTADSCQLITDPETFANNMIFQKILGNCGAKYSVVQQCSTVRLLMYYKSLIGPGFISWENQIFNIFGVSKKKLANANVLALKNVEIKFQGQYLPAIYQPFLGMKYPTAAEAFLAINQLIWDKFRFNNKLMWVGIEESFSALLVASMLKEPRHPMCRLLFDEAIRQIFLEEITEATLPIKARILRNGTDFFTFRSGSQLIPLRFDGAQSLRDFGGQICLTLNSAEIVSALERGDLFPNLILSYFALAIFPKITVVGGASQFEYFYEILAILFNVNNRTKILPSNFFEPFEQHEFSPMVSGFTFESDKFRAKLYSIQPEDSFIELEQEFGASNVENLLGSLTYFSYFQKILKRKVINE
jgi:hypothetical protein